MTYTPVQSTWDRVKDLKIPYWLAPHGVLQEVQRNKKPTEDYHPLCFADRPLSDERIRELFEESGRKPLVFARLIEAEHGIKEWEIDHE